MGSGGTSRRQNSRRAPVAAFNPRVKIILYALLVIAAFMSNSFKVDLGLLFLVSIFIAPAKSSILRRGIIPITIFLFFTFASNALFHTGRIVYESWGVTITEEGLRSGGHLALRLIILILGAKILTASTSADDLIKGMTSLLGPAGRLRTVRDFMSTMSLTLRFLPIIYDESQIFFREALKNSHDKTLMEKIKSSASLIAPLFERSMKRAREMSADMHQ
ncbi:MAG: hypothetical protein HY758_05385 [Nitrospirae bacterium]|nr:hypothetical protein [Nitrospirota bacterium]